MTEGKQIHPSGLNIIQNDDGSFAFEWDPKDERWKWMNHLTEDQIKGMIEKLIGSKIELIDQDHLT
jgi:hypothetical protein